MGRQICADILRKRDDRLIVIVGPCSIHDIDAGLEYCKYNKHEHAFTSLLLIN